MLLQLTVKGLITPDRLPWESLDLSGTQSPKPRSCSPDFSPAVETIYRPIGIDDFQMARSDAFTRNASGDPERRAGRHLAG
jgi:hypothetical protein